MTAKRATRKTLRAVIAFALAYLMAWGGVPAPALAEVAAETSEVAVSAREGRGDTDGELGVQSEGNSKRSEPDVAAASGAAVSAQSTIVASGTWGTCPWEIDANGVLTIHPGNGKEQPDTNPYDVGSPWDAHAGSLVSVRFVAESGGKVVLPRNCASLFKDYTAMKSVDFSGCDVSKMEDMTFMFWGCSSLVSVTGTSDWSGARIKKLTETFRDCSSLTTLDVSSWNTSQVTDMWEAFRDCSSLTTLDVSRWNTSNVSTMSHMFRNCSSLVSLDLSGWSTSSVTGMGRMFQGCSSLTSVGDISGWNTSNVKETTQAIFQDCSSLTSLDLSGWDTSSLRITEHPDLPGCKGIFDGCSKLASLKVGPGYAIIADDMVPDATSPTGKWWSTKDRAWYTKSQIRSSRSRVADTYVNRAEFPDVPADAWYAGVVGRAAELGLISGYKDGRFGPADNVTRGQVAVILWNMAGKPAPRGAAKSFPDVKAGKYYYDAVAWASSVGVVSGYKDGRFGPDDLVTREQLAAMLANYAGRVSGRDTSGSAADYRSMRDAGKVSGWAAKSVGWCFRNKIISGTKDGNVNPQGNATRAETAKMVVFLHDMP